MRTSGDTPLTVNSISELHRLLGLPKPHHPLVTVIDLREVGTFDQVVSKPMIYNFYSIFLKNDNESIVKYGQNYFDFDSGVMSFFSPRQVTSTQMKTGATLKGTWLAIHPDFLRPYPLGSKIEEYGYFSYAINEALLLSEKEEKMIEQKLSEIQEEYQTNIDNFSQDLMVSQIEVLLNYCNRFYNRQFITRKHINNDLLTQFEALLGNYFRDEKALEKGLPGVQYFSGQLNISSNYLSDMLKVLTGRTTQQFIHDKVIEVAKEKLSTTSLTVSEIAYELGFEYPQSFNKLFKNKTGISPLEFRKSFN